MPSIEAKDLTKRYHQVTAIKDVSFSVAEGEIVGFLGPNGAGKSTTMRILCGLIPATSGVARICGIPVASHADEVKRRIGYMPENNPLPEDMRVVEYLRYRASLKEVPRKRLKSRVDEVMDLCDLNRTARRKVIGTLSKGYRQRVGIADAILAEPEVIIMDEPTIGLDPHQIIAIRDLIDSLRGKMTVIISSHILAEIEVSCDRVIIINQGRIVATGTQESLRNEFISTSTYMLEAQGEEAKIISLLKKVDSGITSNRIEGGTTEGFKRFCLTTKTHQNLGEDIFRLLGQDSEIKVRSLSRKESTLEDIFLAATKKSWEETLEFKNGKSSGKAPESDPAETAHTA